MLDVRGGGETVQQGSLVVDFHGAYTTNTATGSLSMSKMLKLVLMHRNMQYMNLVDIIVQITKEDLSKDQ